MKNEKKTSIRKQIIRVSFVLMAVSLLLVGLGSSIAGYVAAVSSAQKSFKDIVASGEIAAEGEIDEMKTIVRELGTNAILYDSSFSKSELTAFLAHKAEQYGYVSIYTTDVKGYSNTGVDFSGYEFFQMALKGEVYFSKPMVTADKTETHIMVSAPIWKDGNSGGEIIGTVCAVIDGTVLSDLMASIEIGETGAMYIVDGEGYTIADVNYDTVLNEENSILESANDPSLEAFAKADSAAISGQANFSTVEYDGVSNFLYAMPLGDTGWAIGAFAEEQEYIGINQQIAFGTVVTTIVALVLTCLTMSRFAAKLTKPIAQIAEISREIAGGNYDVEIAYTSGNEIGDMAQNFRDMVAANREVILDTERCLKELAQGNFAVATSVDYPGVFKNIETAMDEIITSLSNVMTGIRDSSDQVNTSATQVAEASSSLSQGASEQAAAVEQLAATIHQITGQVKENAEASQNAQTLITDVRTGIEGSNAEMQNLTDAMQTIAKRADEINNIIKIIDDIAFQTNILALNAAVEAARAGTAGKGFSVVADEVRSLAAKSAESVKDTSVLIEACNEAIRDGSRIAAETAAELQSVVDKTITSAELVTTISTACAEQSDRLVEVNSGIEQISRVVQSNSAVAEESAAASDELAGQATRLQKMLARFRVRN